MKKIFDEQYVDESSTLFAAMSIALERNGGGSDQQIVLPGFVQRNVTCSSLISGSPDFDVGDGIDAPELAEGWSGSHSTSSTSSIGKNSDESSGGGGEGEEVQSGCIGGALDSLDALEDGLPSKKGISKFYRGKSKSFTSLSDAASCSSVKDIIKPENAFTRKRKNLLAHKHLWDRSSNNIVGGSRSGILKRPTSSRSMLALAAMNNCIESNKNEPSNYCLPPLPPLTRSSIYAELSSSTAPDKFSSWRSFSLYDLPGAAVEYASHGIPSFWISNRDE